MKTVKVILVDDKEMVRKVLIHILETFVKNIDIVVAPSGTQGWARFNETSPDLVITDLQMETEDAGFELAKKIKESPKQVPVIVVSATPNLQKPDYVDAFIEKPVSLRHFVEAVKALLGEK